MSFFEITCILPYIYLHVLWTVQWTCTPLLLPLWVPLSTSSALYFIHLFYTLSKYCLFISKEDLVLISHCENSLDWVSMVSFRWAKCLKRWTLCKIVQEVELYILDRCWGNLSTINYLIRHQWQQPVDVGDPPASLTHSQTSLFGLWNALLTEVDLMVVPMMAVFSIWYDDCVVWYRVIYRLTDSGMHHFCFR